MTEKLRNALQLINMNTAYLDEIEVTMTKPPVAFVLRFDDSFMAYVLIQRVILKLNYLEAKECPRRRVFLTVCLVWSCNLLFLESINLHINQVIS